MKFDLLASAKYVVTAGADKHAHTQHIVQWNGLEWKFTLAETQCETIEIVGYLRVKIFDMASIKMNDFEYVYRRQVTVKCTNKYTKKKTDNEIWTIYWIFFVVVLREEWSDSSIIIFSFSTCHCYRHRISYKDLAWLSTTYNGISVFDLFICLQSSPFDLFDLPSSRRDKNKYKWIFVNFPTICIEIIASAIQFGVYLLSTGILADFDNNNRSWVERESLLYNNLMCNCSWLKI